MTKTIKLSGLDKIFLTIIVLLGLFGSALGLFLTDYHDKLVSGEETTEILPCDINSAFNCESVQTSKYSQIFGIPIAFLGALFYFTVFLLAITAFKRERSRTNLVIIITLSIFSVLYSLFVYYIARYVIGALCLYCIIMYGLNFSLLALSFLTLGFHPKYIPSEIIKVAKNASKLWEHPKLEWRFWFLIALYIAGIIFVRFFY